MTDRDRYSSTVAAYCLLAMLAILAFCAAVGWFNAGR
jgi:hypothetical protein